MESLLAFSSGAPVSAVLLAAILAASLLGLTAAPAVIERASFAPTGSCQGASTRPS